MILFFCIVQCPACDGCKFGSLDTLNQHLIIDHRDDFMKSAGANDMMDSDNDTPYDENKRE